LAAALKSSGFLPRPETSSRNPSTHVIDRMFDHIERGAA
jgi:hypothetical protein